MNRFQVFKDNCEQFYCKKPKYKEENHKERFRNLIYKNVSRVLD